ncbi:MAG: putative proline dipeptidase [Thermomicrobiales bacterium]|nr:putative proline dipeptidase [Thermomicrobiales bacterium]
MLPVQACPAPSARASCPSRARSSTNIWTTRGSISCSPHHNVRYLLGGHHHHFFDYTDAIGVSRYLPILVYARGRPADAAYIANRNEKHSIETRQREGRGLWMRSVEAASSGTIDAMLLAVRHIRTLARSPRRIGVEAALVQWDAACTLRDVFPDAVLVDALRALERLRAVKSPAELHRLSRASDLVVEAMLATISAHGPGATKRELGATLRREETARGLVFEYGLLTVGTDLNRAPSDDRWNEGDILSIDSGGNLDGYIGDLCRMAVLGEPDSELEDLLDEVRQIQDTARQVVRAGSRAGDIAAAGEAAVASSPSSKSLTFVAHGMGLVSHEAPRLTDRGPIPYPASDADLPLESGMVLSLETTLTHPRRGFIKLEDTLAVTPNGCSGFGDVGRHWNRGGLT